MVAGLAGSAAQAHEWGWGNAGYYGWQRHEHEERQQAWNRHERDRHQERMAAIIGGSVRSLLVNLSHR
jgi:hypothetical protein